jgi:hypothetical protein
MKFSERLGITAAEKAIQLESIDTELLNTLWSLLTAYYWDKFDRQKYGDMGGRSDYIKYSNLNGLFIQLWLHYFKKPIDTIPELFYDKGLKYLRDYFFQAEWYEVYDFVEFICQHGPNDKGFPDICNTYLDRENSGYRFVGGKIVEISSTDEVGEIEDALAKSAPYAGVKTHLSKAIDFLSDKTSPDYRNSIKESISAVESLCKKLSGDDKATLGAALKVLESKGHLHPALKSAFSSMYGYTSDAEGIRHALSEESSLTSADARFMLISCSAFINYVISAAEDV